MGSRSYSRPVQIDANQPEIIKLAKRAGAYVKPVHMVKNFCDVIIVFRGVTYHTEIKDLDNAEVPQYFYGLLFEEREEWLIKNRLTDGEKKAREEILAKGGIYIVVWDKDSLNRSLGLDKPLT
jgi:hypothetical protein